MPRQNQDHGSYVRGVTSTTPPEKGGTGATTPVQAVDNLNGLHRSSIDQANGLAMTNQQGLLKPEYFGNLDIYIGPRIKGPQTLYRGCAARFQVMNFASEYTVELQIQGYDKNEMGYVAQGAHFAFVVPVNFAAAELTLDVIYDGVTRSLTLPVENAAIDKPVIKTKDGAMFNFMAWLELEAPQYHGHAAFDEYVPAAVNSFRGNTSTLSADGVHIMEAFGYTGVHQLSSAYPVSEVRISGRLKNSNGYAAAYIDGVAYPLTDVYDEFVAVFKNDMKVDIVTSGSEEIWVAFIRPINGNKAPAATLRTEVLIESSVDGVNDWTPVLSGADGNVKNGLSFPLVDMVPGEYFVRASYIYHHQGQTLTSPVSDSIRVKLELSAAPEVTTTAAQYLDKTTEFGKALCYGETSYGKELFTSGYVVGLGNVVFQYQQTDTGFKYVTTLSMPFETTRSAGENFGARVKLSEDGDYLFVTAPTASYSDVSDTTGAVYVYKRLGGRFVFLKRLVDDNRIWQNYGTAIAQAGNVLMVLTGSSLTRAPSLYVYDMSEPNNPDSFILKQVFTQNMPGRDNWTNVVIPTGFDIAQTSIPFIIFGAQKNVDTNVVQEVKHLCALDRTTFAPVIRSTVGEVTGLPLFSADINDDRFVMSYRGYDNAAQKHIGHVHTLNAETREIFGAKWTIGADGLNFTLGANELALNNYTLPGIGRAVGGFAVSNDLTKVFVGSSMEDVTVDTPTGSVTYIGAGLLYSLSLNISLTEVAPA